MKHSTGFNKKNKNKQKKLSNKKHNYKKKLENTHQRLDSVLQFTIPIGVETLLG